MFVQRAVLLAVLLVGAFAQDARELAVSKPNSGGGQIKVVKNADDVMALAGRWVASLWTANSATVNTADVARLELTKGGGAWRRPPCGMRKEREL